MTETATTEKRIVEINGVKMEVDLRQAKEIHTYKVGDRVKVLVKGYSDYKAHAGIITGLDNFQNLPTIGVAYIEDSYSANCVKFISINAQSKDVEICPANPDEILITKTSVLNALDRELLKAEQNVLDLQTQKNYLLKKFEIWFSSQPVTAEF